MLTTNRTDPASFEWHADNKQEKLECGKILDWMWECHRPIGYLSQVYRHGQAAPCGVSFADFTYCMKLKSKPQAEAEQSLRDRFPAGSKRQYPAGHVWEFRDNGGEDSEQSQAPLASGGGPASSSAGSLSSPVDNASPAAPTTTTSRPFVSAASLATASTPSVAMRHLAACRSCEAMLTPV